MIVQNKIDRFFWIFLILGVLIGFLVPDLLNPFEGYVRYIVMIIMGLLFLKVDILDLITHIKKPWFILYVCFINMIVTPVIIYILFHSFGTDFAIAVVLLASLPSGVTAAVITDIMKGRTPLSLTIIIVTNLVATFTIPFIFWLLFKTSLSLSYWHLFKDLASIVFIPLLIAKILKRVLIKEHIILKLQDYANVLIMILVSLMIMISVAYQADYILTNYKELLKILGILYILFFTLQIIGYFSVFWRNKKGGKVAVSNSNMVMNIFLGILLGLAFFPPKVVTIIIMAFIPWSTMIVAKHWYKKYLP
ncbi:MAG: hypothetical protein GY730_04780 [bacterium]|nr:hypothetical protein [bacterium]